MTDVTPSIDDMEKQLQDEVVADLGRPRPIRTAKESESRPGVEQRIDEGRNRLKDLLEGDR